MVFIIVSYKDCELKVLYVDTYHILGKWSEHHFGRPQNSTISTYMTEYSAYGRNSTSGTIFP